MQKVYKGLQEIPKLATGTHSIRIQLVTTSAALSSEPVELKPSIKFTVLSKGDLYTVFTCTSATKLRMYVRTFLHRLEACL